MIHDDEIENAHFFEWKLKTNKEKLINYRWEKKTHTNYSQIYIEKRNIILELNVLKLDED